MNLREKIKIFSKIFQEYFAKSSHKVGGCGSCYHVYTFMNWLNL
jgi:hypothetical protein